LTHKLPYSIKGGNRVTFNSRNELNELRGLTCASCMAAVFAARVKWKDDTNMSALTKAAYIHGAGRRRRMIIFKPCSLYAIILR
jgi:poly(3-hydroxybutyrate) depolymerase